MSSDHERIAEVERRSVEIECQYAELEDTVAQINQVVIEQSALIEDLRADVAAFRQLLTAAPSGQANDAVGEVSPTGGVGRVVGEAESE